MGKELDFFWFSGTGNTLRIVREMAGIFEENGYQVNLLPITRNKPLEYRPGSLLGIGFPVAEQGTYPAVWNFIENLPDGGGAPVFMVDTMMLYSGGVKGPVGKILRKKNFLLKGAREIRMPNNFFKKRNSPRKDSLLLEKGLTVAREYAEALLAGRSRWRDIPLYSDWMASFSRKQKTWDYFLNKFPLRVAKERCAGCGLCERLCPAGSISMAGGFPGFGKGCWYCMRCFSLCPSRAIGYGSSRNLRYSAVKSSELIER
ncbi:MAG: 4Fe-4S binding protein [Spirochaetales bacterium]|jgi:NAD-dependent dihydropyrimidine dehydrogenase PreA subunit/flavodoxin|nr:4Fe-4S binding protein [Spirochaetales bacterium]